MLQLTAAFETQEAWQLALTAFLLVVSQQLVNKLPDQLLSRRVQYWKYIDYQGVHIPGGEKKKKSTNTTYIYV